MQDNTGGFLRNSSTTRDADGCLTTGYERVNTKVADKRLYSLQVCVCSVENFNDLKAWDLLRSFAFGDKDYPKLIRLILPEPDSSEEDADLCKIKYILKETMKVPVDCWTMPLPMGLLPKLVQRQFLIAS